jgi:hypothetical protein
LKNRDNSLFVVVRLEKGRLKDRVLSLIEANRVREAFDLLRRHAEFEDCLFPGSRLEVLPQLTLIEDFL